MSLDPDVCDSALLHSSIKVHRETELYALVSSTCRQSIETPSPSAVHREIYTVYSPKQVNGQLQIVYWHKQVDGYSYRLYTCTNKLMDTDLDCILAQTS